MGPRPDGRGKTDGKAYVLALHPRQWGRGQTAAERGAFPRAARTTLSSVNGAAARRPRKADIHAVGDDRLYLASMGPRPDGRGKPEPAQSQAHSGRASMGPRPDGRGKAEGPDPARRPRPASMGPRPDGRGKSVPAGRRRAGSFASMGPRPDGRGKQGGGVGGRGRRHASMGPRPDGRGKKKTHFWTGLILSVNGAAARRPRKASAFSDCSMAYRRQWGRGQTAAESTCTMCYMTW